MPRKRLGNRAATGRFRKYKKLYPDATANDIALLQQLAVLEVEAERIDKERGILAEAGGLSTDAAKKLGEAYATASRQALSIQEKLGITRGQRQEEVDNSLELKRYISGAKKFLAEHTAPIRCPNCAQLPDLNLGYIYYVFQDLGPWTFEATCPNCLEKFSISGGPPEVVKSPLVSSERIRAGKKEALDTRTQSSYDASASS